MLIWTPLKNSKGPLGPLKGPTRRPKMHIFTHYAYFLKNCSATFSLLVHIASIWWALFALWRWTPLNRSKGPSRGPPNLKKGYFCTFWQMFQKLSSNFSSNWMYSFYNMSTCHPWWFGPHWNPLRGPWGPLRGPPIGQKCIFSHIMPIFSKTVQQLFLLLRI